MDLPRPIDVFLDLVRPAYEFNFLNKLNMKREKGVGTIEELLKGEDYYVID